MFGFAFRSALQDFLRPGRLVTWGFVAVFVGVVGVVWRQFQPGMDLVSYGQVTEIVVFRLLALASAVFSMQVLAAEVEQRTVVYLLTRGMPRWQTLLARGLASWVAVVLVSWSALLAAGLGVLGPVAFQTGGFWRDWLLLALGAGAYGALFIFVSLVLNKAMIYCLLFAFGWETFVPNLSGDLYYASIYPYLTALADRAEAPSAPMGVVDVLTGGLGEASIPAGTAAVVLPAVTVVLVLVGLWWFSRFEYSPREDSD